MSHEPTELLNLSGSAQWVWDRLCGRVNDGRNQTGLNCNDQCAARYRDVDHKMNSKKVQGSSNQGNMKDFEIPVCISTFKLLKAYNYTFK